MSPKDYVSLFELIGWSVVVTVLLVLIHANVKSERYHPTFGPDRDKTDDKKD